MSSFLIRCYTNYYSHYTWHILLCSINDWHPMFVGRLPAINSRWCSCTNTWWQQPATELFHQSRMVERPEHPWKWHQSVISYHRWHVTRNAAQRGIKTNQVTGIVSLPGQNDFNTNSHKVSAEFLFMIRSYEQKLAFP